MTFDERVQALDRLPPAARVAFAAACAERALGELRLHRPDLDAAHPELRSALDVLWSQAGAEAPRFTPEMLPLHDAAGGFVPLTEDDPRPDPALLYSAQAIALGFSVLRFPADAARTAAFAGGAMLSLVGNVYQELGAVQTREAQWQDALVERLSTLAPAEVTRAVVGAVPEYQRGAVSQDYLDDLLE
jgi:hypothetical protein